MKKYQCKTFFINSKSSLKVSGVLFLFATIAWAFKIYSPLVAVFFIYSFTFFLLFLFALYGEKQFYAWEEEALSFSRFNFSPYQMYGYNDFKYAVISNASGELRYGSYLMKYKISKNKIWCKKIIFPYITLFNDDFFKNSLIPKMTCLDVSCLKQEKLCIDVGICWFDSFREMLEKTNVTVYILEDVYLRFKGAFDNIILDYKDRVILIGKDGRHGTENDVKVGVKYE